MVLTDLFRMTLNGHMGNSLTQIGSILNFLIIITLFSTYEMEASEQVAKVTPSLSLGALSCEDNKIGTQEFDHCLYGLSPVSVIVFAKNEHLKKELYEQIVKQLRGNNIKVLEGKEAKLSLTINIYDLEKNMTFVSIDADNIGAFNSWGTNWNLSCLITKPQSISKKIIGLTGESIRQYKFDNLKASKVLKNYKSIAEKGNANAQLEMYLFYMLGRLVDENEKEGLSWLKKSAKNGNINAQKVMAYSYQIGDSFEKDLLKSYQWSLKAAKQGDAEAQFEVAYALLEGTVIPLDLKKSREWLMTVSYTHLTLPTKA